MQIKSVLKKMAAVGMAVSMAFTLAPTVGYVPEVIAADETTTVDVESTVNLKSSKVLVTYKPGTDVTRANGALKIVVIFDDDYSGGTDDSTLDGYNESNKPTGVVKVVTANTASDTESKIEVSKAGNYTVYYKYGDYTSYRNDPATALEGPAITIKSSLKEFSDGFEITYRCTNEAVDYKWEVYDKVPTSNDASIVDSYSGGTIDKGDDIENSSNSLEKNKTYYLVLTITGDTSRADYIYPGDGAKYKQFKTLSDESKTASGNNTDGSSSSNNSSSSSSSKPSTKKVTNKDGSVTETTTSKQGTVSTTTISTTWTDKSTKATTRTHTVETVTDSTTGTTKVRDTDKAADGSYMESYAEYEKDKSYSLTDIEATAKGNKSVIKSSYNSSGTLTGLSEESVSNGNTTLKTTYKVGSGKKLTVKKISSKKGTVDISDVVTARKVTKYSTSGVETEDVEYTVTGIGANALKGNKKVKKVIINSDIKSVGKNAFKNAKNLKTVEISGELTKIGSGAFSGINGKAVIKIEASKKKYNATKKLIKASGIAKTVKIKKA